MEFKLPITASSIDFIALFILREADAIYIWSIQDISWFEIDNWITAHCYMKFFVWAKIKSQVNL